MNGPITLRRACLVLAALSGTSLVDAHSWVERLQRLAAKGTMLTPVGYQRGYVGRDNPTFKGDVTDDLWQLPINDPNVVARLGADADPICSPQQSTSNYTTDFPQLVAAAGDYIAMQHQENGHVTLPETKSTKPRNRGTIYIYGTEKPSSDDTLSAIHNVWNVDGTGGDGRGRLIATRNYDDGQCYQTNTSPIATSRMKQFSKVAEQPMGGDFWCQADIQLPTDITTGSTYTLYWVWDWPTLSVADAMPGESGVTVTEPEVYTSCMDLTIVDPCSEELGGVTSPACDSINVKQNFANSFVVDQNLGSAGVPQQLTGNFAVPIDDVVADSSSNDGLSAPPNLVGAVATATGGALTTATGGAAANATGGTAGMATPTTLQTVATPTSKVVTGSGGAQTPAVTMSTVTVTQGVETVTVTANAIQSTETAVLVTEGANGQIRPAVTPFALRRRSRIEAFH